MRHLCSDSVIITTSIYVDDFVRYTAFPIKILPLSTLEAPFGMGFSHVGGAFVSTTARGCTTIRQPLMTTTPLALSPADVTDAVTSLWDSTMHLAAGATAAMVGGDGHLHHGLSDIIPEIISDVEHDLEVPAMPPQIVAESLSVVGHDLVLFLAAAVLVDPLAEILGVSSVLLYLLLGFVAGPYGLSLFVSGTEANSELGDFGILFLLFVEGLNLSPERLKALGSFFSLGATQLLLSVGIIFFGFFFGGPYLLPFIQDVRVPIDPAIFSLLEKPVIAFSIAAAGALSSSAFVLPILKEKKWERGADGIAALSILLLQDLAVAPLLVILPLIADFDNGSAGSAIQDPAGLGLLVGKATVGFGAVLALASVILRRIFQVVASYGSSQTFVAASLLVAVGMGIVADDLGLSATTGAFVAGVLLAESGYRAQIEADVRAMVLIVCLPGVHCVRMQWGLLTPIFLLFRF